MFHYLSVLYMLIYGLFPRWIVLWILGTVLVVLACVEFLRIRRPELNAWFLARFSGLHRTSEILAPSGIFWTLLGCWLTMATFTSKKIVLPALGFLAFGDAAAALMGRAWGRRRWRHNPDKTWVGSGAFALVATVWASAFVHWPVAITSAAVAAWIEARRLPWNDNLWIPFLGASALSVLNLVLGRR
jgi:dolichol kinase